MSRILDFADGFQSSSEPTSVSLPAADVSNTPSGNLSSTTMQDAVNELQGDIDTINAKVGSPSGIASLDVSGKIPTSQIPALAIIDVNVVADIAARDALTVQEGDVALVTDAGSGVSKTYIYDGTTWIELKTDGSLASHTAASTGIHGVTGSIVGTSDSQVLTNKDIDGGTASNTSRITLPKAAKTTLNALTRKEGTLVYATDEAKAYVDNGTALVPVGSGSGSGTVNFVTNPKAETDTSNAGVYNDGDVTRPVDGTGGTATVTLTRNTSNALDTTDYLITKPVGSVRGQGYYFDVAIPRYARGKVVQISLYYEIASGTYSGGSSSTDSDLIAYTYNVTDSVLQEPAPMKLDGGVNGIQYRYTGTFQTSTTATSYRLLLHHATTSTSAFTMKVICSVSPQVTTSGAFVSGTRTDWTPTLSTNSLANAVTLNATGSTPINGRWRRVGDWVEISVGFKNGSGGAATGTTGALSVSLPPGIVADTAKMASDSSIGNSYGSAQFYNASTLSGLASVQMYPTFIMIQKSGSSSFYSLSDLVASASMEITARFPVVGWDTAQTSSAETDGRDVVLTLTGSNSSITSSVNVITPLSVGINTHGTFSGDTYTCPFPGIYDCSAWMQLTAASYGATQSVFVYVRHTSGGVSTDYVLGGNRIEATASTSPIVNGMEWPVQCKAGDTLKFVGFSSTSTTVNGASAFGAKISRRIGQSQILGSESVNGRYFGATATVTSSFSLLTYSTKDYDSYGNSYSSGTLTIQTPGKYTFTAKMATSSASSIGFLSIAIFKNGVEVSENTTGIWAASASGADVLVTDDVNCVTGDLITIRCADTRTTPVIVASNVRNYFTWKRTGN